MKTTLLLLMSVFALSALAQDVPPALTTKPTSTSNPNSREWAAYAASLEERSAWFETKVGAREEEITELGLRIGELEASAPQLEIESLRQQVITLDAEITRLNAIPPDAEVENLRLQIIALKALLEGLEASIPDPAERRLTDAVDALAPLVKRAAAGVTFERRMRVEYHINATDPDAVSYEIWSRHGSNPGPDWKLVGTVPADESYFLWGEAPGIFRFRNRAIRADGSKGEFSSPVQTTVALYLPNGTLLP